MGTASEIRREYIELSKELIRGVAEEFGVKPPRVRVLPPIVNPFVSAFYDESTLTINLSGLQDVDTLLHELAHHIMKVKGVGLDVSVDIEEVSDELARYIKELVMEKWLNIYNRLTELYVEYENLIALCYRGGRIFKG